MTNISIHAPHTRSDQIDSIWKTSFQFQSTLLIRGATSSFLFFSSEIALISIHAPHTRSDNLFILRVDGLASISIHAPHTRSDEKIYALTHNDIISIHAPHTRSDFPRNLHDLGMIFQSTLLIRGATRRCHGLHGGHGISIHAPHTRSDTNSADSSSSSLFQSTLLIRGATLPPAL